MKIATTKCGDFGHIEFLLEADENVVPDLYLKEVAVTIENMVAEGSVFRPQQTFQIGWMITKIDSYDASHLTLFEPDMKTFPINWVTGISHTLRQKMVQVFMLDSVSLRHEMLIPNVCESLIACTRYTEPSFFMSRSESMNERDSGWFVGCRDGCHDHNDAANLRCILLYEAYLHQRGFQGFVMFPIDSVIALDEGNGLTVMKNGNVLRIESGSFWILGLSNESPEGNSHPGSRQSQILRRTAIESAR
jgi:hypothetical protein